MIDEMRDIQQKIADRFDCINDWFAEADLGFKSLPISGRFIRSVDLDTLISRIQAMLPSDVKLLLYNGVPIQLSIMQDTYFMVFASHTWPPVAEGQILPKLEPIFFSSPTGEPVWNMCYVEMIPGLEYRLTLNKQRHKLVIRKEDETDERVVVRIEPINGR